ncbi:L,D-transpeptidase family protein [Candidatus Pelagibacter communis]|uniref:L,D-transpeptidase family protein n=1 Tax=Pelagibacter ubique TaxID=198252 RepID=UPI00094C42DA|nr:L,D-transpeptidase family protein [Candidatus Pelagibacter ubique]
MTILVKNKHTLQIDEFKFRCCIGKNGSTKNKKEGDKKTPKGTFEIENLYFRGDRKQKPATSLKCIEIKKYMGWCDDIHFPKKYNKLFKIKNNIKHEKLKRRDYKYNLLIPIKYNFKKPIVEKGSCIFIHLTKNYRPTAGCIALKEKDFLIMLKLIKKNSKIKIL